jgi:hypothetical protein
MLSLFILTLFIISGLIVELHHLEIYQVKNPKNHIIIYFLFGLFLIFMEHPRIWNTGPEVILLISLSLGLLNPRKFIPWVAKADALFCISLLVAMALHATGVIHLEPWTF